MCIAIYKPAGKVIDRETLHRCYLKNKDGCGFAYFKTDGELVILKAMDFESFYEDYEFHSVLNSDRPFLIHFRIATHGTVDIYNCHPFQIDENHVMMHNGIIHNIRKCPDKKRSDTQMFVDDILKELPPLWMSNPGITNLIEDYIGSSKVVVLSADDAVSLYNEKKGEWDAGVWYSNSGYKETVSVYKRPLDSDYYGARYAQKTTPHNYERPNVDPVTGVIGVPLFGRWEYKKELKKAVWIEVARPAKTTATINTPNSTWEKDELTGEWGWVAPFKEPSHWKYNKETGIMEEFKGSEYTGNSYPAGYATKQKHLALVSSKSVLSPPPEREYETCCSCCQTMQTDALFVVDEFREVEDCLLCADCIAEYISIGMSMSNPIKVSDVRAAEEEALDRIFDTLGREGVYLCH